MNRIVIVALVLIAAAAGAYYLGYLGEWAPGLEVATTSYDTDADGNIDLTRHQIGTTAILWHWDRNNDGSPEIIAYDCIADAEGTLHPTGEITAWDFGGDGLLEQGQVPVALQDLLRSEALERALAAEGPGHLELVDMDTREFVAGLRARYDEWRLSGFRLPLVGAGLPDADRLLPGARRAYRFGIHQGFDMYPGHVGTPTAYGGPVVAAKDGAVIRADIIYQEITAQQYADVIATSRAAGTTPPPELDVLRGRQIWIDHGHGIVSRYAHLSAIAPGVREGARVQAGDIIGFVGNSGLEAAARESKSGAHLHFELRIDDRYLGEGETPEQIRSLARRIFKLAE